MWRTHPTRKKGKNKMLKPNYHNQSTDLSPTRPYLCSMCGRKHDWQTVCLTDGATEALVDLWRGMELWPAE